MLGTGQSGERQFFFLPRDHFSRTVARYRPRIDRLFTHFLGSGPGRGRSPVEWGDFPSVRPYVRTYIRTSIRPSPLKPGWEALRPGWEALRPGWEAPRPSWEVLRPGQV